MGAAKAQTKKFGGGERTVPHHSEKASKYYPAEDLKKPKTVRKTIRPTKYRSSLQPGSILILLAGRFRGKRVVLLKTLDQGTLLVTGPYKFNGVPIRRVNSRYVLGTSTKVDLKGVDSKLVEKVAKPEYFAREKGSSKKGEDAFFKQGEKPEKKEIAKGRVEDQKSIDKSIITAVRKTDKILESYLKSSFALRNGDKPHKMVF